MCQHQARSDFCQDQLRIQFRHQMTQPPVSSCCKDIFLLIISYYVPYCKSFHVFPPYYAAGLDYVSTSEDVIIFSTPFLNCTMIPILEDSVVENREQFFVVLNSNDPAIQIGTPFAIVNIMDTSGSIMSIIICVNLLCVICGVCVYMLLSVIKRMSFLLMQIYKFHSSRTPMLLVRMKVLQRSVSSSLEN